MTFQQIMSFHPDNETVYQEIKRNLSQLLPFVGAGLTASFYQGWGAALTELGKNMASSAKRDELSALLKQYKYLEAAQLLEDTRGGRNLARDMVHYFSRKKLVWNQVREEAIFLLPLLFRCPVLTTNFDEGIEMVYHHHLNSDFRVLDPFSESLRTQATDLKNTPCLFKLHGSIYGDMTDTARLVFTKRQYRRHYGWFGKTKAALRQFVRRRSLLFLGCSLEQDRTVEVIRTEAGPGKTHYAIVNGEPGKQDARVRALEPLGIRAIVYPDGQYDSVQVILEQLLNETDRTAYLRLDRRSSALQAANGNPYVYRARMTTLRGRESEMKDLVEFVTGTQDPFRWWAVVGPGGSGKSRLALELTEEIRKKQGWSCIYLKKEGYGNLSGFFDGCTGKTLVVADYVQAHAGALGAEMERLAGQERALPLRLLLVERDDAGTGADWTSQLYGQPGRRYTLEGLRWKDFQALAPLPEASLDGVIQDFAESLRINGLSSREPPGDMARKALLKRLYSIDPGLHRPLYAMFLTGAWMQGEDPAHWSRETVLEYIISRECDRLYDRMRELTGAAKPNTMRPCLALYRLATAMLGPEMERVKGHLPNWNRIEQAAESAGLEGPEELLERMGLSAQGKLVPMEPDIMGEYFVYAWLTGEATEPERRCFLRAVWSDSGTAFIFFERLFRDYAHLLNKKSDQWELLFPPLDELVPESVRRDGWMYAWLTVDATYHCQNVAQCQRMTDCAERVYRQYPDDREIAVQWASGLVNLMAKQDESGCTATLKRLEQVYNRFPDDREITVEWAKGLFNLMANQDEAGHTTTLQRLEEVYNRFPGDQEIAEAWARGLVNHMVKQDEAGKDVTDTFQKLEQVHSRFPDDRETAVLWAGGLVNLMVAQAKAVKDVTDTFQKLEQVHSRFPDDRETAVLWARGLVLLSDTQAPKQAQETLNRIQPLLERFPGDGELAYVVEKGQKWLEERLNP